MDFRESFTAIRLNAQREEGQTTVGYGVVLTVIALGVIVALGALALAISGKLGTLTGALK